MPFTYHSLRTLVQMHIAIQCMKSKNSEGKCPLRAGTEFFDPFAQHVLVYIQSACSLCYRHNSILNQLYRFKLILEAETPAYHLPPPISLDTTVFRGFETGSSSLFLLCSQS